MAFRKIIAGKAARAIIAARIAPIILSAALCAPQSVGDAAAQTYPSRPVQIVVPYPPGGPTDIAARLFADQLARALNNPVVVENRAGASGNIGAQSVKRAAPDGHTFIVVTTGHATNQTAFPKAGYDLVNDFEPVGLLTEAKFVVVARPESAIGSVADVIRLARQDPGKLNYASGGIASTTHLCTAMLVTMANISMTHVPYQGSAPANRDVMGGTVDLMCDTSSSVIGMIRAGRLKAIATTGTKRLETLPDVATVAESLPGYVMLGWNALLAPKGLPAGILDRVNLEVNRATRDSEMREKLAGLGLETRELSVPEMREFIASEVTKMEKIVRAANINLD